MNTLTHSFKYIIANWFIAIISGKLNGSRFPYAFLIFVIFVIFIAFAVARKPPNVHRFIYTFQSLYLFKWHPFVHNLLTQIGYTEKSGVKKYETLRWSSQHVSSHSVPFCFSHAYRMCIKYTVQRTALGNQIDKYECVHWWFSIVYWFCYLFQLIFFFSICWEFVFFTIHCFVSICIV